MHSLPKIILRLCHKIRIPQLRVIPTHANKDINIICVRVLRAEGERISITNQCSAGAVEVRVNRGASFLCGMLRCFQGDCERRREFFR